MDCKLFNNGFCYYKQNCKYHHKIDIENDKHKKLINVIPENKKNFPDVSKMIINRFNLDFFPKFIQIKIHVFILSQYNFLFKNYDYQDLCELLIQELFNLYKKYIKNYKNPYILSFCKADCSVCKKNIINECYSELVDFNYGWNYCIDCEEYVKTWLMLYSENNYYFPINYIENLDLYKKVYFYRSTKNDLQEGYINDFSKHLYIDKKDYNIYILLLWDTENKMIEKWVLLKNLVDNNKLLSNIKFLCPPYWSSNIYNYWNNKLKKIKEIHN